MQPEQYSVFISWLPFQRRSETLSRLLGLELRYFHFKWEESHKLLKAVSYLFKFADTMLFLFRKRPDLVFFQLPPTPCLYAVALYAFLTKKHYVADCHNNMIYDGHWIKWPMAKVLLSKANLVLVHNSEVQEAAHAIGLDTFIYMDPPPLIKAKASITKIAGIRVKEENFILLPSNMAAEDEPAEEFFKAARLLPARLFVLTGYKEKVPAHIRKMAPANVKYTGYLGEDEFNVLYKNADLALVLSTREGTQPSGASEAISSGVPLVVTDMEITREIYQDTVCFTMNTAAAMVDSIQEVLQHRNYYKQKIIETKALIALQTNEQYHRLVLQLASFRKKVKIKTKVRAKIKTKTKNKTKTHAQAFDDSMKSA